MAPPCPPLPTPMVGWSQLQVRTAEFQILLAARYMLFFRR